MYVAGGWWIDLCATGGRCSQLPRHIVRIHPLSSDVGSGGWTVNGLSAGVATVRFRVFLSRNSTCTLRPVMRTRFIVHGPGFFSW